MVKVADFVRAVQDGSLPYVYNSMVVSKMFQDMDELDFYGLAQTIYAFRLYKSKTHNSLAQAAKDPNEFSLNKDDFKKITLTMPTRLQNLINNTMIPTLDQVEKASKLINVNDIEREAKYLRNYNNMIFLQKSHKVKKHQKHRSKSGKGIPQSVIDLTKNATFPSKGSEFEIFFNMMRAQTNNFVNLENFLRFYRFSSLYLEIDPYATCTIFTIRKSIL